MCAIYSVLKQIKAKEARILVLFHLEDSLVDSGGVLHTCELRMLEPDVEEAVTTLGPVWATMELPQNTK